MILLFAISVAAAQPRSTASTAAETIVADFFRKAIAGDATAYSVVSSDASIGINDVGMPMTSETVLGFVKDCRLAKVVESASSLAEGPDIRVVDAALACSVNGKSYEMQIDVMVHGSKIAGAYIK